MTTPKQLADELGLSAFRINGILRQLFPRSNDQRNERWDLTIEQADAVRMRARSGRAIAQAPTAVAGIAQSAWFWEGNVQSKIPSELARRSWEIVRVASTATKERGDDILARYQGHELVVEVKGYPSDGYADPRRAGEVKSAPATLQAHHWLADAVIHAMRILGTRPTVRVAIGLPRVPRYEKLLAELQSPLRQLGIGVILVSESGAVEELLPALPR